jgi:hypothetical protein
MGLPEVATFWVGHCHGEGGCGVVGHGTFRNVCLGTELTRPSYLFVFILLQQTGQMQHICKCVAGTCGQ